MVLITQFLTLACLLLNEVASKQYYTNQRKRDEYDYIIVGAGSSGAVLASRLSEDTSVTVLLLEAGGEPDLLMDVPLYLAQMLGNLATDWNYYTEPQKNACLGLEDKRSFWPRFKGLGGCSSHNYMVYCRGAHRDYDEWAKNGANGWSWNDVLPFFKKAENNTIPELLKNGYHGTDGYLTVSSPSYKNKLRDAYLEAGQQLGYDIVDYNGPNLTGFSEMQLTQRNGRRCSTEKSFLRPAAVRPNLDILLFAHVVKVDIDPKDKRATGVVYEQGSQTHSIKVKREIVLSAGAIGTPQLLMLSGIGPKEHLQEMGIPLIADLPVGLNLQDHIIAGGMIYHLNDSVGIVKPRDVDEDALDEFVHGRGVLTSPGGMEIMAFVKTKYENSSDWPDIQIEIGSIVMLMSLPEAEIKDATTILPIIMRPKSRGYLKLRSKDPHEHPIIDPQYYAEEEDLLRMVEGMKIGQKLMETPALQRFDPKPVVEALNGTCQDMDKYSDKYWACVARTWTYTDFHPCCTAKMGDPKDPTTVVDAELRVKGVKSLRVADASIMPTIPTSNTNAPCIMIGEKLADMLKKSIQG